MREPRLGGFFDSVLVAAKSKSEEDNLMVTLRDFIAEKGRILLNDYYIQAQIKMSKRSFSTIFTKLFPDRQFAALE